MAIFLTILALVFLALFIAAFLRSQHLQKYVADLETSIESVRQEWEAARQHYESETIRVQNESQLAISTGQKQVEQQRAELLQEAERIRLHYESEWRRIQSESEVAISNARGLVDQQRTELLQEAERIQQHYDSEARKGLEAAESLLTKALQEMAPLKKYASLRDAEAEVKCVLEAAMTEATALRQEAQDLLEQSRTAATEERSKATQRAKEIREQSNALLNQATLDAGRIVEEATKRAEQIGGEAYIALRDKQTLEQAVDCGCPLRIETLRLALAKMEEGSGPAIDVLQSSKR